MTDSNLVKLRNFIATRYSLDEIRELCFALNAEYEELGGAETRRVKARAIIIYFGRRRQLEALLGEIEKQRPRPFAQLGLSTSPEAVEWYYEQLGTFEDKTMPLSEKLLKNVGVELRLGFVALAILLIGVAAFLFLSLREEAPRHMTGDFRAAVAGFSQAGGDVDELVIRELADSVFLQIERNLSQMDVPFTVSIWGPEQVGSIQANTPEDRAREAERIAGDIRADVVVYGVVDTGEPVWEITPEFFISDQNLHDAHEITGQYKLGVPFSALGQGDVAKRIEVGTILTERAALLSKITVGLAYYASQNYSEALNTFQQLDDSIGWDEVGGEELVHVLIGNSAGRLGDLAHAEKAYKESMELDPEYARAYAGLGIVHYLKAYEPVRSAEDFADIDMDQIDLSIEMFGRAAAARNQPALSDIPTKVRYGLGQAYLAQSLADEDYLVDRAVREFESVISVYAEGKNPRVRELAGEAQARLGLIYEAAGECINSAERYADAARLLYDNVERQQFYEQRSQEVAERADDCVSG
jgi:tetratricopeptide (TPR) repeat protein